MIGYHITSLDAYKDHIQHEGLVPRIGDRSQLVDEPEERIYFFPNLDSAEDAIMGWLGDILVDDGVENAAILRVDLSKLDVKKTFDDEDSWEVYVTEPVSPDRIELVREEPLNETIIPTLKDVFLEGRTSKVLQESISKRAYHFTNYSFDIVKENRLHASSAIGSGADMDRNKGRLYFISLTRSGIDGYNNGNQKIVIDGEKLSLKYKGGPVDYWAYPRDMRDASGRLSALRTGMEKEDRIFLNQPFINDIRKYIVEIHADFGGYKGKIDEDHLYDAVMLKNLCDEFGIPVYFYNDRDAFLKETKSARINFADIPEFQQKYEIGEEARRKQKEDRDSFFTPERNRYSMEGYIGSLVALLCYNNKQNEAIIKEKVYQIGVDVPWPERTQREIDKDEEYYFSYEQLKQSTKLRDYVSSISSDIHNIRTHRDEYVVLVLNLLSLDMKRFKAKGLEEYVQKKMGVYEWYRERENNQRSAGASTGFEYVLEDDGGRGVAWDQKVDWWISNDIGDIYRKLPKHIWRDKKTIGLFNNKDITLSMLYKFLVKEVGRKFADQVFKDELVLTVKKEPSYG